MNAAATKSRIRASNPLNNRHTAQAIKARAPLSEEWVVRKAGGGETLFATGVGVPDTIATGGVVDVSVAMTNAAVSIGPSDGDSCSVGLIGSGYEYKVTVEAEWGETKSTTKCLNTRSDTTHEFALNAPSEPGTYTIDITIEGTGTGFSGGGSREVVIEGTDDGGDNGDGDDDTGDIPRRDPRDPENPEDDLDPGEGAGDGEGLPGIGGIGATEGFVAAFGFLFVILILVAVLSIAGPL